MTRCRIAFALFTTACAANCVPLDDDLGAAESAITGGQTETGYPAVFSLADNGAGECTATCITPKVALTANHCIAGKTAATLTALFGNSETAPTKTIQVTAISGGPAGTDIAIMALAEACPAVIPYNRSALEPHIGDAVVMVGFGVTSETGTDYGIKRSATATLFSVSPANVLGMVAGELATSNQPGGTCYGDSGGPTFATIGGVQVLLGTTSRGSMMTATTEYPCGQGRSIAVRTDTYKTYIEAFIAQHDPGAGTTDPSDPSDPSSPSDPNDPSNPDDPGPGTDAIGGGSVVGGCSAGGTAGSSCGVFGLALLALRRRRKM